MHKKSKRDEALVLAYNRIIRENKDASKLFTCRLMDLVINSPAPSFFLDEFTIARYINLTEKGIFRNSYNIRNLQKDLYAAYLKMRREHPEWNKTLIYSKLQYVGAPRFYVGRATAKNVIYKK